MRYLNMLVSCFFCLSCNQIESAGKSIVDGYDPEIVATCQAGCGATVEYSKEDVVHQLKAKVGDLVRCPVSGVIFELRADSPKIVHNGRTYRTCCHSCSGVFENEPQKAIFD